MTISASSLGAAAGASGDTDLQRLAAGVRRDLPAILTFVVVASLLAILILYFIPPRYTSRVLVLIDPSVAKMVDGNEHEFPAEVSEERIANEVEVMRSRELASVVMDELKLWDHEAFAKDSVLSTLFGPSTARPSDPRARRIERFLRHLSVFRKGKSAVIAVEYTARDPMLAADVVNALADAYLREYSAQRLAVLDSNIARLTAQVQAYTAKVDELEGKALEYRARNRILSSNPTEQDAATLAALNRDLLNAQLQVTELRERIKHLEHNPGNPQDGAGGSLLSALEQARVAKQEKAAALQKIYGRLHPEVLQNQAAPAELAQAIETVQSRELDGLRNALAAAEGNVRLINGKIRALQDNLAAKETSLSNLTGLERELGFSRTTLAELQARLNDATLKRDATRLSIDKLILSRGYASPEPSAPLKLPILALTAIGALLLGLLYSLFKGAYGPAPAAAARTMPAASPPRPERKAPPPPQDAPIRGTVVSSSLRTAAPETLFQDIARQLSPENRLVIFRTDARTTRATLLPGYVAKSLAEQKPGQRVLLVNLDQDTATYLALYKKARIQPGDAQRRFFHAAQILLERSLFASTIPQLQILDLSEQSLSSAQLSQVMDEVLPDYSHVVLVIRDGSLPERGAADRDLHTPNRFLISESDEAVYRLPDANLKRASASDAANDTKRSP